MSHIQVDLKVIEVHAPAVARVMEEPVAITLGGLSLLWHRCWSTQQATISRIGLGGIFGMERLDLRLEALIDAGFLEAVPQVGFRIRGAEKYLRIRQGNSKGGKAASGNLKRGTQAAGPKPEGEPGTEPGGSREVSRDQAGEGPRLIAGSTPITDHRSPITTTKEAPPRSEHQPTIDRLTTTFTQARGSKYPFKPRDAGAVKAMLESHTPDDIAGAWGRALAHRGFPRVSTIFELEKNLAHFLGTGPPVNSAAPAPPSEFSTENTTTVRGDF
jgi:hypothetical protein